MYIHSFTLSDHFYMASSSPLQSRSAPDTSRILCRSFTPKRHHTYICMYVCMYVCICVYVCIYVCVCIYIYVCISICMCIIVYVCKYIYMYVYVYACILYNIM